MPAYPYDKKPGASAMARLLKAAAKTFASPKYMITDQGGEFLGKTFVKAVSKLGILQRFGSTENIFATARLERFWRTLKHTASLRLHPPPSSVLPMIPNGTSSASLGTSSHRQCRDREHRLTG